MERQPRPRLLRVILWVGGSLLFLLVLAAILLPVFSAAREKGRTASSHSPVRQLLVAESPPAEPAEPPYLAEEAAEDKTLARASGDTEVALSVMAAAEAASARKVIKTAEVEVEVESVPQAQKRVLDLLEQAGGFVASLSVTKTDEVRTDARIVARVPADRFRAVYEQVKQLGEVFRDTVGGQDVTEEYMDLEARIANKRVEEEALRAMLRRTGKVSDLLLVEGKLSEVRGQIERYQGRLRYLKDQIQFSTITVSLFELGQAPIAQGRGWQLSYHVKGAWHLLVRFVQGISRFLIYTVIVGAPIWVVALIIRWRLRVGARRRARSAGQAERQ